MLNYMLMPYRKYAQFQGRSRRAEYWWFTLFVFIVSFILAFVDIAIRGGEPGGFGILGGIFSLATLVPSLAVGVRRLHDTDRTGWWILIGLIPLIGFIVLLIFYVQDGTPGTNKFGPSPKHESDANVFA